MLQITEEYSRLDCTLIFATFGNIDCRLNCEKLLVYNSRKKCMVIRQYLLWFSIFFSDRPILLTDQIQLVVALHHEASFTASLFQVTPGPKKITKKFYLVKKLIINNLLASSFYLMLLNTNFLIDC